MAKTFYLSHTSLDQLMACNGKFYSKYAGEDYSFSSILTEPSSYDRSNEDDNGLSDSELSSNSSAINDGLCLHLVNDIFIKFYNLIYNRLSVAENQNEKLDLFLNEYAGPYKNKYSQLVEAIGINKSETDKYLTYKPFFLILLYLIFAPRENYCNYQQFHEIMDILIPLTDLETDNPKPEVIRTLFNDGETLLKSGIDVFNLYYISMSDVFNSLFQYNIDIDNHIINGEEFDESLFIARSELHIKSLPLNITSNYSAVFYGIVDIYLKYETNVYILDLKSGSTSNIAIYPDDYSADNQLMLYQYIMIKACSETLSQYPFITEFDEYYSLYVFSKIRKYSELAHLIRNDTENILRTNIISALKTNLLVFFVGDKVLTKEQLLLEPDTYTRMNGHYLSHSNCVFLADCDIVKDEKYNNEMVEVITKPLENKIKQKGQEIADVSSIYKVHNRIGIIDLSYYDCDITTYAGKREPVITNKDQIVSLDQNGQIIYEIKGELDEATFILSFVNSLHMLEVVRFIKAQQIISNVIPFYNSFLAKLFLPYDVCGSYYNKILGASVVSSNLNNLTLTFNEPAKYKIESKNSGMKYDYVDSLYGLVPVYCNIINMKLSSVQEQTNNYVIELLLGKVSIEIMQMYDNKYVADEFTLKNSIEGFMDNEQYKNPFLEIYSNMIQSNVQELDVICHF